MKNEAENLSKTGLNRIWNIICDRFWKFDIRKSEKLLKNKNNASVWLYGIRSMEEQPMYVACTSTVFTVRTEGIEFKY
jgi:hypothetical protein